MDDPRGRRTLSELYRVVCLLCFALCIKTIIFESWQMSLLFSFASDFIYSSSLATFISFLRWTSLSTHKSDPLKIFYEHRRELNDFNFKRFSLYKAEDRQTNKSYHCYHAWLNRLKQLELCAHAASKKMWQKGRKQQTEIYFHFIHHNIVIYVPKFSFQDITAATEY